MELDLNRVDYIQVGLTHTKCGRLLPAAGIKGQQKFAVGDRDGVLQVFSLKKGDLSYNFKTLPGKEITRLELGGALGTVKDKIFVSVGTDVRGYTKKGKLFLDFGTNLTESIESMSISGSHLLTCGNHVYNHYIDCKDTNYFMSEDVISDVLALPGEKVRQLTPVLACNDRSLKVLKDSSVMYKMEVPGPPTCLSLFYNDGGDQGDEIIFGTADGKIGLVQLLRQGPHTHWLLEPDSVTLSGNSASAGAVQSIDNYDITGDGMKDLIVGRHDGNIEIYAYDDDSEPILKFAFNCGESVNSVEGGILGTSGFDEIVATTYTGWVFGLTSESGDRHIKSRVNSVASVASNDSLREKIEKLRSEIEILQGSVNTEREKYQQNSTTSAVSAIPALSINDMFTLSQTDASYLLSLEVQTTIDNVLLRSDVPIDLLDVEKNSAVVSYSKCDPESGNVLLATYRCQANTTRLEIKIRTIEGQYGTLQAYVTPRLQPKFCQVQEYRIKPLSLHMRTHKFDESRPFNRLRLTGTFSIAEMHTWIRYCLPEVPEKAPSSDVANFVFMSTFLDTMLHVEYSKGWAIFRSDNISTISILKDFMSKEATRKKIFLDISCDVNDESVIHTLQLLHPKLESQILLAKQVALIEPLKDLSAHEEDTSFFSPEYAFILEHAESLEQQFKRQPAHLERLYGMITDLFIDQHKFKGENVKSRVGALLDVLDKYTLEGIIEFFKSN